MNTHAKTGRTRCLALLTLAVWSLTVPTHGAILFHRDDVRPAWSTGTARVGRHIYYR